MRCDAMKCYKIKSGGTGFLYALVGSTECTIISVLNMLTNVEHVQTRLELYRRIASLFNECLTRVK